MEITKYASEGEWLIEWGTHILFRRLLASVEKNAEALCTHM